MAFQRVLAASLALAVASASGSFFANAAWADQAHQADPHAAPAPHAAPHVAPHTSPHDSSHGGLDHNQPAPINWVDFGNHEQPPFVALVINVAVLFGLYYYFGKKPVAEALKNRRREIAKEIEDAQRLKKEAEERAKTYQAKLETLEQELGTARDALIQAGIAERDRMVCEAREKAERLKRDAQFLVEQETKQLQINLLRETIDLSVAAAEDLLKKRLTPADHERLVEDYLADLGKMVTTAAGGAS